VITGGTTSDGVEFRVIDNGHGIPSAQRTTIFQPFERLSKDVPGSGLGLATCERIVTAHGGRVSVSETPGGGATFLVSLPDSTQSTNAPAG
jgi:signal transduction histidine kinase